MTWFYLIFEILFILLVIHIRKKIKIRKDYKKKNYNNNMRYAAWKNKEQDSIKKDTAVSGNMDKKYYKYYTLMNSLLTPTEQKFYTQLKQALKQYNVEIHYKVRLADIFRVKYINEYYSVNLQRIAAKHIDFVITEIDIAKPILAIELDDYTHDFTTSQKNDTFKNELYADAGIKLLRIKVCDIYDFSDIKKLLERYMLTPTIENVCDSVKAEEGDEVN